MADMITVRGRVVGGQFVPDAPLPAVDGPAQLIILPPPPQGVRSAFEAVGSAPVLLDEEQMAVRLRELRED